MHANFFLSEFSKLLDETAYHISEAYGFLNGLPSGNPYAKVMHAIGSNCKSVSNTPEKCGLVNFKDPLYPCFTCLPDVYEDRTRIRPLMAEFQVFAQNISVAGVTSAAVWRAGIMQLLVCIAQSERNLFDGFPTTTKNAAAGSFRNLHTFLWDALASTHENLTTFPRSVSSDVWVALNASEGSEAISFDHTTILDALLLFAPTETYYYRGVWCTRISLDKVDSLPETVPFAKGLPGPLSEREIDTSITLTEDGLSFPEAVYTSLALK